MQQTGLRRGIVAPLFLISLGWARLTSGAERIKPASAILTEEGQAVAFDQITWQLREMAKRLPLDAPWPGNPNADNRRYLALQQKLERFTLDAGSMRWDILLPGHGTLSMDRACPDVGRAREPVAAHLAVGREVLATPFATTEHRARLFGRPATR